jgi:hypothetical protein
MCARDAAVFYVAPGDQKSVPSDDVVNVVKP